MNELNHTQSINTVAEMLNLTPRRVRQFCENEDVPRLSRGQVDLTWSLYFHAGSLQVEDWPNKPRDPKVLVALAWLSGLDKNPNTNDIDTLAETFKRNGHTRDDALRAIGKAEGILEND